MKKILFITALFTSVMCVNDANCNRRKGAGGELTAESVDKNGNALKEHSDSRDNAFAESVSKQIQKQNNRKNGIVEKITKKQGRKSKVVAGRKASAESDNVGVLDEENTPDHNELNNVNTQSEDATPLVNLIKENCQEDGSDASVDVMLSEASSTDTIGREQEDVVSLLGSRKRCVSERHNEDGAGVDSAEQEDKRRIVTISECEWNEIKNDVALLKRSEKVWFGKGVVCCVACNGALGFLKWLAEILKR